VKDNVVKKRYPRQNLIKEEKQMKKAKLTKRTLSLLLTLAMLLGMLPVTAAAAEQLVPQDSDYKGFSMENSDSGRWISYDQFSQKETTFYYPINLTEGNTWTKSLSANS
jgi:hypothetical protein